jgi:hypothetical protein
MPPAPRPRSSNTAFRWSAIQAAGCVLGRVPRWQTSGSSRPSDSWLRPPTRCNHFSRAPKPSNSAYLPRGSPCFAPRSPSAITHPSMCGWGHFDETDRTLHVRRIRERKGIRPSTPGRGKRKSLGRAGDLSHAFDTCGKNLHPREQQPVADAIWTRPFHFPKGDGMLPPVACEPHRPWFSTKLV